MEGRNVAIIGYLTVITATTVLLCIGLWKLNRWAAWVATAFVMYTLASDGYRITALVKMGMSFRELVIYGWIPAVAWAFTYLVLIWLDKVISILAMAGNLIRPLRRERVPLG